MSSLVKNAYASLDLSISKILSSCLQVLGASLLIALSAQISIPLYFSPVPLTGQTFTVMLIGALLGSRKGMLSVLTYLAEGSLGLPFFTNGGFGLLTLVGPTGGYLIGFVFQAYLVGWFIERQTSFHPVKILSTLIASSALQLTLGTLWLSFFLNLEPAITLGFYPFVYGEVLKAFAVTSCLKLKF